MTGDLRKLNWKADSTEERFRVLNELASKFIDTPCDTWGFDRDEIEKKYLKDPMKFSSSARSGFDLLKIALPDVLIEWYQRFGRLAEFTCTQNRLVPPDELTSHGPIMVIYEECQGCSYAGIRLDDLTQSDPPVYFLDMERQQWHLQSDTVSSFAITVALEELSLHGGRQACVGEVDDIGVAALEKNAFSIPIETLRWHHPAVGARYLAGRTFAAVQHAGTEFIFAAGTGDGDTRQELADLAQPGRIDWHPN